MKHEVVVLVNDKVTIRETYNTAERAHERYKEIIRVSKKKMRDTDKITVFRLQDDYPMAVEDII